MNTFVLLDIETIDINVLILILFQGLIRLTLNTLLYYCGSINE